MASKVTINEQAFIIGPDQDVDDLKRDVRTAVRNGGELVTFEVIGNSSVSVLVSQGVPVVFETTEPAPEGHEPDPDDGDYFQDYYGYDG